MSTFYLFPNLAPELRQYIWGLSLEPRVVSIKLRRDTNLDLATGVEAPKLTYAIFKASPPVGFSVCRESRSFLRPLFTEVLPSQDSASCEGQEFSTPTWVDFAIDTVQCKQYDLPYVSKTPWAPRIRNMVVDVNDLETMHRSLDLSCRRYLWYLEHEMTGLEHLMIRDLSIQRPYIPGEWREDLLDGCEGDWQDDGPDDGPDDWQDNWHDLLAEYYYRCEPLVSFHLRIVNPRRPDMGEVNQTNFMDIWRHARRIERGITTEGLSESSPEEDVDILGHHHTWIHNGKDCLTKCGKVTEWP